MIPKLGSCYYPEHWSETQWEKDAKDMICLLYTSDAADE